MLTVGADQNSVTEDIPFQSTSGASPNFLKYNTAVVTQAESKAENITGITTDFAGTIRQGNPGYTGTGLKPDIGAWELEGILPSCSGTPAPSNTIASLNPACAGQPFLLSLSVTYTGVTYQWQSSLDNIIYNDIPGATNPTQLENGPAVATWYRAIISCNTNTQTSTPVQVTVSSPLTGIYTINNLNPTAGSNFNNFDDAIETLNCRGVSGSVTFNVTAGQVFPGCPVLHCLVLLNVDLCC